MALVQSFDSLSNPPVDRVVQSVTNATKRLLQISTNTSTSSKKRKAQNRIGPWKLGRTLGRGSTGRVRLAKNVHTGQLAAVKIVPKLNFRKLENPKYRRGGDAAANAADAAERLPYGIEREIIIMKLILHPNIMALYDVWENKNDLYLILEYIEGGELFDYLIRRGKLAEREAVAYFRQIIDGIHYLHQFNICHRDLKPENLLLDVNRSIKIADFGMAALEVHEKLLETLCGLPHYASPEIVAGKNYHGAPLDIWLCGIILFALLTGHLPFDDDNIRRLLLKVQSGKFVMPPDLSSEASDLIARMLKVNPRDRISIEHILRHPLMQKYGAPPAAAPAAAPPQRTPAVAEVDREILKNLLVLFHNCSEHTIVAKLQSPHPNNEKMFYSLLMKYRDEHTGQDAACDGAAVAIPRLQSVVRTVTVDLDGLTLTRVKTVPRAAPAAVAPAPEAVAAPVAPALALTPPRAAASPARSASGAPRAPGAHPASTSFTKKKATLKQLVRSRNSSSRSLNAKRPQPPPPPTPHRESPTKRAPRSAKLFTFESVLGEVLGDKVQIYSDAAEVALPTRHVTVPAAPAAAPASAPPAPSSLDPRGCLLRAKLMAQETRKRDHNTVLVLRQLGIDVDEAPPRISTSMKTTSSKNLAQYLAGSENKENLTISRFNDHERREPGVKASPLKFGYKLMLETDRMGRAAPERADRRSGLIPNPRFSKFSFNGLLNESIDEETAGPAAPRAAARASRVDSNVRLGRGDGLLKKSSTVNLSGLGIVKPSTRAPSILSTGSTRHSSASAGMPETEFSNFDLISSHTADLVTMRHSKPSLVENVLVEGSKETLVHSAVGAAAAARARPARPASASLAAPPTESIESMYKGYGNFMADKTPRAEARAEARAETPQYPMRKRVVESSANSSQEDFEDTSVEGSERRYSFNAHGANIEVLDTSSLNDHFRGSLEDYSEEDEERSERPVSTSRMRSELEDLFSRGSTQIFSTMNVRKPVQYGGEAEAEAEAEAETEAEVEAEAEAEAGAEAEAEAEAAAAATAATATPLAPRARQSMITEAEEAPGAVAPGAAASRQDSLFRRLLLKPKRNAPLAPPAVGAKKGWFKRLMEGFVPTKRETRGKGQDIYVEDRYGDRNVQVIDSQLVATDLLRVVQNTMQLKKVEGLVEKVVFDEEFGMFSGAIPTKFAGGRKLRFRIEVIDLVSSSSLHVIREKGSERAFRTFVKVVEYTIRQEEQAVGRRNTYRS